MIREKMEKWVLIEESVVKQKSRNQWLQLGDDNSSYFLATMKSRMTQNNIRTLVDDRGNLIERENDIQEQILGYYKQILGEAATALPAINPQVMKDGQCLTRKMQLKLIKPVSELEVRNALNDIDDNKAPGYDGFNAIFFKKAWNTIRTEITEVVI
uniref:Uncharacterized protein n=1 Tax=Nicotiana tabacum TaxID=4097 RepID=A0A1S3YD08_TOBAC|nr:PREDICTED: uncharacterized protein LOC107774873 [Nicotiana tabacum]